MCLVKVKVFVDVERHHIVVCILGAVQADFEDGYLGVVVGRGGGIVGEILGPAFDVLKSTTAPLSHNLNCVLC